MPQFQPGHADYTQGFGTAPAGVDFPVIQTRAPTTTDANYGVGKVWVDSTNNAAYILSSISTANNTKSANWQFLGGASGAVDSVLGTTNQVTVTTASNVATVSLPSAITAPGSLTTTTTLTATAGAITATNGNVVLGTAGNKLVIATGSNASVGTSDAMTAGAVTVATTASSATAKIFYSRATTGGTPGNVSITAQDGTGFTLTSTSNTETSTFNWWIINA